MKIIIMDAPGTGKTTVAQLITDALIAAGLQVKNCDPDIVNGCSHPHLQDLRLAAMRERARDIEIVVVGKK